MFSLNQKKLVPIILRHLERTLAILVIVAVLVYTAYSTPLFLTADWAAQETFYDFINRVLLIIIGLELARMLVAHSFLAILELFAFVIARKMLNPEIIMTEAFLGVISFVAILGTYRFFVFPIREDLRSENIC